jgi:exonuclease VII small subunit
MALDELHARRLATVARIFEGALDRMEQVIQSLDDGNATSPVRTEELQRAKEKMEHIRRRINDALVHFSVRLERPDPRQVLAAELSTLWVVLENARPERMKGYGREFSPQDKRDWTILIESLLEEVEELRRLTRGPQ